jgi:hypothetical protein
MWSSLSLAHETMVCTQYGHTSNPEQFHSMGVKPRISVFITSQKSVIFGEELFSPVDAADYDMEGLANTYLSRTQNKILYLYTNEQGEKEIGISKLEDGTDSFFGDKSLFAKCSILEQEEKKDVAASGASLMVERINTVSTGPTYRF